MRDEVLRKKKAAKAAMHRKDYERRLNINRNIPSVKMVEKVPVYKTYPFPTDRYGKITSYKPQVVQVGFKEVIRKVKKPRYHKKGSGSSVSKADEWNRSIPMIPYPPRKTNVINKTKQSNVKKSIFSTKVSKSPSDKRTPSKTSIRGRKAEHERGRLSGGEV